MNRRRFAKLIGASSTGFLEPLNKLFGATLKDGASKSAEAKPGESVSKVPGFPKGDYTPFGYLDNPFHSWVHHRSGIFRSVPPIGFGFWVRRLPWPYGLGAFRDANNYLSFLHLSVSVDGTTFHNSQDFAAHRVEVTSQYHTKSMMSYDWQLAGLSFSAQYFVEGENSLICVFQVKNSNSNTKTITFHATNIYGFPEQGWWGSDGVHGGYNKEFDSAVAKFWAYGDIFALSMNRPTRSHKFTSSKDEWEKWIREKNLSNTGAATHRFSNCIYSRIYPEISTPQSGTDRKPCDPGCMYSLLSTEINVPPQEFVSTTISLTRNVSEKLAIQACKKSIEGAPATLGRKLADDENFYRGAPQLAGDWPSKWKHGWIYDLETLRMTIRPPVGIYKHHWDGMQIFTPRSVLGEASLDSMAISYADTELAKDVLLGTFADAPAPNVPCSREDGSLNMICADGSETGTAPMWGYPFLVMRSIYLRDHDDKWIRALYPYLKSFIKWWHKNRADSDGWFHCMCSWESGQDASKRFLVPDSDPAAAASFVRTVDVQAAIADAEKTMIMFAKIAGQHQDVEYWQALAEQDVKRVRSMYVDGWFHDFDGRTGTPIKLKDYYDVMMLAPLTVGIATHEQVEGVKPMFNYFKQNAVFWLEWPSFAFPFCEAAWNVGLREFIGEIVAGTAERVYMRLDSRQLLPLHEGMELDMPKEFAYRMPGVANEFWPIDPKNPGGCENYGWGATLPTLIIRNIIGFRESADPAKSEFVLAPSIPPSFSKTGQSYGISNLNFRSVRFNVNYQLLEEGQLEIQLASQSEYPVRLDVKNDRGELAASVTSRQGEASSTFKGKNGGVYHVSLTGQK
jgi:hypothetical protein